jgi:hypothetical protein
MEGWLKTLIAGACVVVIGGGAYFAWGEFQEASRMEEVRATAQRKADAAATERALLDKFSSEACARMARETLPQKSGQPLRTEVHKADIRECDKLGRYDAGWRQALDFAGVL